MPGGWIKHRLGKSCQAVAALAANVISVLPVAHPSQGCAGISCLLLEGCLQPHSCGQAGSKWRRKHLQAGKNKSYVFLFKGKGRSQTEQDESTGGVSEVCCEQLNISLWLLVLNFSQGLEISGGVGWKKKQRNLQQKGNSGYLIFSPPYTQPTPKVLTRLVVRPLLGSATAELFRDPAEVLKRHCQASTHLTGQEKKFCHSPLPVPQ